MKQHTNRAANWIKALLYNYQDKEDYDNYLKKLSTQYNTYIKAFFDESIELKIFHEMNSYFQANSLFDQIEDQKKLIIQKYTQYEKYQNVEKMFHCIELDLNRLNLENEYFNQYINEKYQFLFLTNSYLQRQKLKGEKIIMNDILSRILYIYARVNPQIGYVSGMTQILGILKLVVEDEILTFFCFQNFMNKMKEYFQTDTQSKKYESIILQYNNALLQSEPVLYKKLEQLDILSSHYCLIWFITCFSSNFQFNAIVIIWDKMLTRNFDEFNICFAIKLIQEKKQKLLVSNFEEALLMLQLRNQILTNDLLNYLQSL